MIRSQPSLQHLTGESVSSTPDHRSFAHIRADAGPKIMGTEHALVHASCHRKA